jgi:hypothetical protein
VALLVGGGGGDSKAICSRGGGSTGAERNAHGRGTLPCHPESLEVLSAHGFDSVCL